MITIVRRSKKRVSVFQWILATALFTVSCTTDVWNETEDDANAICFQAPQTESRAAVEGSSLPANSSFLVWGGYDNNVTNVFDGETVSESNGVWNYEGGTRYWIPGKTYSFYGVYPATLSTDKVNVGTDGTITITDFDCSATGENAVDLMTAFATGDGDNPQTVNMQFGHELARVSIVVRSRFADAELSEVRLYGMAVKGGLSVSEAHSSWDVKVEDLVTYESTPYRLSSYSIEMGKDFNLWGDLLVIPQAVDGLKLKVQYTIGGQSQESEVSLVTPTLKEWVASQSYRYILTLESDGILFENLTADAWGETSSGGSIIIP